MADWEYIDRSKLTCPQCGSTRVVVDNARPPNRERVKELGGGLIGKIRHAWRHRGEVHPLSLVSCGKCSHKEDARYFFED